MDSRRTLRYPIDLFARLRVGETELSARVRLTFKAPRLEPFDGWCVTRWTTAEGCGLAFEDLQPLDAHQLARLIRAASRMTGRLPTDAIWLAR